MIEYITSVLHMVWPNNENPFQNDRPLNVTDIPYDERKELEQILLSQIKDISTIQDDIQIVQERDRINRAYQSKVGSSYRPYSKIAQVERSDHIEEEENATIEFLEKAVYFRGLMMSVLVLDV